MKRKAFVVDLSPSTRAVVALSPSGQQVHSVTFMRGTQAFTLSGSEARKLLEETPR